MTTSIDNSIPKDPITAKRCRYFLQKVNQKYLLWKPIKRMCVCNLHFRKGDVHLGVSGRRLIASGCFPAIIDGVDITSLILENVPDPHDPEDREEQEFEIAPFISPETQELYVANKELEKVLEARNLQIASLEATAKEQKNEKALMQGSLRTLEQRCKRNVEALKSKDNEIKVLKESLKRSKTEWTLPKPVTEADEILTELIQRRCLPKSHPYSENMKQFAFNAHYVSPKGYDYVRTRLGKFLPDPSNCSKWTRHVTIKPGLLGLALDEIKTKCAERKLYYSLAFDEVAIRQQIIFNGNEMVGRADYGGLSTVPPTGMAKSALFCLGTEINGSKSFPIAYILTDGLKAQVMAEFVDKCISSVKQNGGNVITIACDGLQANFSALKMLGARFDTTSDYRPYIFNSCELSGDQTKTNDTCHYIVPDISHMMKLARNNLHKFKIFYNQSGQEIKWEYVSLLHSVQEEEQLRAANNITSRHIHFQKKKMNTRLCVQILSSSAASAIDFCRGIGIDGFEDSEATTEFFRINDEVFDTLNARPFGNGRKAALSFLNKMRWTSIISSAREYYLALKVRVGDELVPLHETKSGTFVKGIICCLSSVSLLMEKIEAGSIDLMFLPTYRLSQDPIEVFFGTLRRRLGNNDNPNVQQLAYSVRAVLCFKLKACNKGNAFPQEMLQDKLSDSIVASAKAKQDNFPDEDNQEDDEYDDTPCFESLSLFVENVVVYIAGFVGRKLSHTLECTECVSALKMKDMHSIRLREDYLLVMEKDRGGLFKPSEDLLQMCKIIERVIRVEQVSGIFNLIAKRITHKVKRECVGRSVFNTLHDSSAPSFSFRENLDVQVTHKWLLIGEICKIYIKTRLHYVAKRSSLGAKPVTNRSKLTKLVHFTGY